MESEKASNVRKRIEESNALFLGSSREGKRVILAMDIIYQLAIHRMIPTSVYFDPGSELFSNDNHEREVKEVMGGVEQCYVCGIGSFFMAAVERLNEFKFTDFNDFNPTSGEFRQSIVRYIAGHNLLTRDELHAIESFFEYGSIARRHPHADKWAQWDPDADTNTEDGPYVRLKRIAETVIRTEGKADLTLDLLMTELPTGEFDPMLVTP